MANIEVIFDHSNRKYSPGEIINLEIRVDVTSDTTVRRIYVKLHGFAQVEFQACDRNPYHVATVKNYTLIGSTKQGYETYFKNYKNLIGSKEGPDTRLIAGSHVLYASYLLPQHLPENHEGGTGYIRYEAKVQMVKPFNFDKKEKVTFFIKPHYDLNRFQRLRVPLRNEAKETFGSFCWKSDPLYIYNVLPRSGFIPGESVQYTLEFKNNSDVSVLSATVKLIEKIIYRTQSPRITREKIRTLWTHTFSNCNNQIVAPLQNKVFSTDLFFNPAWCFHFFDGCKIIDVEYNIISEAHTDMQYPNLITYSKIYMGTIPFGNFSNNAEWFQSPSSFQPRMPIQYPMSFQFPMSQSPIPFQFPLSQSPMSYQSPMPIHFPMSSQTPMPFQSPISSQSPIHLRLPNPVQQVEPSVPEQPLPSYEEATRNRY